MSLKKTPISNQLSIHLEELLGVTVLETPARTNAGKVWLNQGAFSWMVKVLLPKDMTINGMNYSSYTLGREISIGSSSTMTDILKARQLDTLFRDGVLEVEVNNGLPYPQQLKTRSTE